MKILKPIRKPITPFDFDQAQVRIIQLRNSVHEPKNYMDVQNFFWHDAAHLVHLVAELTEKLQASSSAIPQEPGTETYRLADGRTFTVAHPYYIASCNRCGWVGSSQLCRADDFFGDDSDVYCPNCHRSGADCGKVAEQAELISEVAADV